MGELTTCFHSALDQLLIQGIDCLEFALTISSPHASPRRPLAAAPAPLLKKMLRNKGSRNNLVCVFFLDLPLISNTQYPILITNVPSFQRGQNCDFERKETDRPSVSDLGKLRLVLPTKQSSITVFKRSRRCIHHEFREDLIITFVSLSVHPQSNDSQFKICPQFSQILRYFEFIFPLAAH